MARLINRTFMKPLALAAAVAGVATAPLVSSAVLEEVIITAQKQLQTQRDVPVSVAAMTGDTMQDKGFLNLEAVSASIPTLHIGEAQIGSQLFIRGIGSGVNAGFEQSVGTYVDGIYFGRGRQSRGNQFDVARIEVLKGPQGTLFGKNTIAGALNITTVDPTAEFEGSVSAMYEFEHEETILSTTLSGPLSETVSARLAMQWTELDSGWIENTYRGTDEPTNESTTIRVGLNWEASDDLNVLTKYTYNDFEAEGRNSELSDANGKYPGAPFVGNMPVLLAPFGESGVLDNKRNVGGTPGTIYDRDISDTDANSFMVTLDYVWGDYELTSITGYTDYSLFDAQDNDMTPLDIIAFQTEEDYEQYSQEFRLTSPGGETIDYIVGFYYQYDELDTTQMINVNLLEVGFGSPVPGVVPDDLFGPPIYSARYVNMDQETTSWALFSQITWNITDEVRTTLGLRWAEDEKKVVQELRLTEFNDRNSPLATLFPPESGLAPGFVQIPIWGGNLGTFEHNVEDKFKKDNFTPSISVMWDFSEDTMFYASVTSGYKGGGYDAGWGRSQDAMGNPTLEGFQFEQEEVLAYELGAKTMLADGSVELNMALFRNEFDDVQVSTFDGGLTLKAGNAAEVIVEGFEVEGRWGITDSLTMGGSLAYIDAYYDSFPTAQCYAGQSSAECTPNPVTGLSQQDLSGENLQFSPDWSAHLNLEHIMPLGAGLELTSALDVNYSGEYYIAADLDERALQDSFTKLDFRVALSDNDGVWEVAFVGRNLTDEETSTWANDTALAAGGFYHHIDRLRSYAISVKYSL